MADARNRPSSDLRPTGGDLCGPVSNSRWGQNVLTNNYDPNLLKGWGVRPSDWDFGISVQQQLLRRMSVEVAYHRRSFAGFTVQDNTLVANNEYDAFSVIAPNDPALPGRHRPFRAVRAPARRRRVSVTYATTCPS